MIERVTGSKEVRADPLSSQASVGKVRLLAGHWNAQLLDELENKRAVADLLDRARDGTATRIFIGSENRLFALSGSSVIAAPYRNSEGRVVGVVGVIGPTRLNYARLVPIVDFTAQSLGRLIG